MARLINADKMIEDFERYSQIVSILPKQIRETTLALYAEVVKEIQKQPTVVTVEVLRCNECKNCTTIVNEVTGESLLFCEHWKGYPKVDPAGYCYFGERRTDG